MFVYSVVVFRTNMFVIMGVYLYELTTFTYNNVYYETAFHTSSVFP